MFIQLDLGWMDHPFPLSSFKVTTDEQVQTILALGLQTIRYYPERSDVEVEADVNTERGGTQRQGELEGGSPASPFLDATQRRARDNAQHARTLLHCERRFTDASRRFRTVVDSVQHSPKLAHEEAAALVTSCVDDLLAQGDSVISLLSESVGERSAQHPVNVMVLCLLLGRALELPRETLASLGLAALLHDIGKQELPLRYRMVDESFSSSEYRIYQDHVARGVAIARRMGLAPEAVAAIAQHHEMLDGSGFPAKLQGPQIHTSGKILALVNRYDNFCNPPRSALALTPHEALSVIFAQMKPRFDPTVLGAFIRMMGVYPPGSVVQLGNDRYAIVVSVNSSRPLRPRVLVHDPAVARVDAGVLDLETAPELGIRRSLKPAQLPKASLDYLSPRSRICYFFERAVDPSITGAAA
ncbi:HD-GYP domain-containing protein [Xylophilus rhododendri]|nr:HD-GYP domain-containing protein [Xylophilus rhododendri]